MHLPDHTRDVQYRYDTDTTVFTQGCDGHRAYPPVLCDDHFKMVAAGLLVYLPLVNVHVVARDVEIETISLCVLI